MSTAPRAGRQAVAEAPLRHFCTFWIADRLYGVDIHLVREIFTESNFTPIFHAPPQIRGYVNIRGQIHLVVDPRHPLGLPPPGAVRSRHLLIFKHHVAEASALLVDRVGDILEVREDRLEPVEGANPRTLCTGVVKLDGQLMELLNPPAFLVLA